MLVLGRLSFFFLFTLMFSATVLAQNSEVDSMLNLLTEEKGDSLRIAELYNEIGWELKVDEPDRAKEYLLKSIAIAERNDFKKEAGDAYNYLGVLEDIRENLDLAATYWAQSLEIRTRLDDKNGMARIYNNLGINSRQKDDYTKAISYYRQAELLYEELNNPLKSGNLAYNIANTYEESGHYSQAIEYIYKYLNNLDQRKTEDGIEEDELDELKASEVDALILLGNIKYSLRRFTEAKRTFTQALELNLSLGNDYTAASIYNDLGNVYSEFSWEYKRDSLPETAIAYQDSAILYYERSLQINEREEEWDMVNNLKFNMATCARDKSFILKELGDLTEAKELIRSSEEELERLASIWRKSDNAKNITMVESALFDAYLSLGKYPKALKSLNTFYDYANKNDNEKYILIALDGYSKYYKAMGQYQRALDYSEEYNLYRFDRIDAKRVQDNEKREALYLDQKNIREIERQKKDLQVKEAEIELSKYQLRTSYAATGLFIVLSVIFVFLFLRFKKLHGQIQQLLLNILPPSVVKRIQKDASDDCAQNFSNATILFSDFAGFTEISAKIPPEELLGYLNKFFTAFDEIIDEEGIERIKTIGDAYMCVAGVPDEYEDHAERMLRAAFKMREAVKRFNEEHRELGIPEFRIRIGINSGPISGGIVGVKKYAYDVWGDAVNVASRMESNAKIGSINISDDTYKLVIEELDQLKDIYNFDIEERNNVNVKGKGEMDMYTFV